MTTRMSVTPLNQPTTFAGLSDRVEEEIERAFWVMLQRRAGAMPNSDRDAFKWAVREMFKRLRDAP
jgi:hypothetical protein